MIPMKFYRDDEYVYINNPDGTTKKVAIEDFESAISGEGGGGSGFATMVVNVTASFNPDNGYTITNVDADVADIKTAFLEGSFILAHVSVTNASMEQWLFIDYVSATWDEPPVKVYFEKLTANYHSNTDLLEFNLVELTLSGDGNHEMISTPVSISV